MVGLSEYQSEYPNCRGEETVHVAGGFGRDGPQWGECQKVCGRMGGVGHNPAFKMVAILKQAGTWHVSSEVLKMSVNSGDSWSVRCFRVDGETETALRGFCLLKSLWMSLSCKQSRHSGSGGRGPRGMKWRGPGSCWAGDGGVGEMGEGGSASTPNFSCVYWSSVDSSSI